MNVFRARAEQIYLLCQVKKNEHEVNKKKEKNIIVSKIKK